jgi:hypothetical protein
MEVWCISLGGHTMTAIAASLLMLMVARVRIEFPSPTTFGYDIAADLASRTSRAAKAVA